jgi:hypothetical protein
MMQRPKSTIPPPLITDILKKVFVLWIFEKFCYSQVECNKVKAKFVDFVLA